MSKHTLKTTCIFEAASPEVSPVLPLAISAKRRKQEGPLETRESTSAGWASWRGRWECGLVCCSSQCTQSDLQLSGKAPQAHFTNHFSHILLCTSHQLKKEWVGTQAQHVATKVFVNSRSSSGLCWNYCKPGNVHCQNIFIVVQGYEKI